jgi:hypothetical protein
MNSPASSVKRLAPALLMVALVLAACSGGVTPAPTAAASPSASAAQTPAAAGAFDPASVASIVIDDFPVVPDVPAGMRALYQTGLAAGNDPHVFSKLGDCMTENPHFLAPFSAKQYDLGAYADLQPVLDQFLGFSPRGAGWDKDSFSTVGLASAAGFNVAGPLDPTWADPTLCRGGESPLACEYRVARPSLAVIMFGTNDVNYTDAATYDTYLRLIVQQTLAHQTVPILSTFPTRPEDPAKTDLFNKIALKIAQDYGVPIMNLTRALRPLPDEGVDPNDTIHLSRPPDDRVDVFDAGHLQYGFTVRNLVTLQALDAVWRAVR